MNLRRLTSDLREVTDWHGLGIRLGINISDLDKIESKCKGDIERCKTKVLHFWKRNDRHASVGKLSTALEEIDHRNLAEKIREEYNVPQIGV